MYGRMWLKKVHGPPLYGGAARVPAVQPSGAATGGNALLVSLILCIASPICLRLLAHCVRAAASRTFCTAGTKRAIRMAMIAITTKSSISVKPTRLDLPRAFMGRPLGEGKMGRKRRPRDLDGRDSGPHHLSWTTPVVSRTRGLRPRFGP